VADQGNDATSLDPTAGALAAGVVAKGAVAILAEVAPCFTYASYQNAVPVLRALALANSSDEAHAGLRLELTATPPFLRPKSWIIDRLAPGDRQTVFDRLVHFDLDYLRGLNEAERGEVAFVLREDGAVMAEARLPVRLLARDEWGGVADMAQLLAAFVMPNDPAVAALLRAASDALARNRIPSGMDGYQSGDPRRARLLAAAIYAAGAALGLHYAEPPPSFEARGQKIRRPSVVTASGFATCLDSTLLFAAAFEAAGLNPVVLLFEGHAAVGVWLSPRTLPLAVMADPMEVRKAIAAGEMMVFETTGVTRKPVLAIDRAQEAVTARLGEAREREFRAAIDVKRLRDGGITPLPSHEERAKEPEAAGETAPADPIIILPPPGPEPAPVPPPSAEDRPTTPEGRIARWQKKLLDLTLSNRLLNFKDTRRTVPFLCTDAAYLENRLAAGATIRIISLPEQNPLGERDPGTFRDMRGQDIHLGFASEALARDELPSPLAPAQLEARLIDLYRAAKNDLSEGGTNTLFLAVGFLRWRRGGKDHRAPLLLVPVKLERVGASARFNLRFHEDEPRFNATLLKFLESEFSLSLPQLEEPLPEDGTGVDVAALIEKVRTAVREVPGLEVVGDTALSTFSFAKYLMWKDLVERAAKLRENRLVRHLIDTPDAPFPVSDAPAPEPADLDRAFAPREVVCLLPADSSQTVASVMAAAGHDMVIVGPPGTGKSQTIANMIAHCLAVGKSVLFVAEKAAALNVVHRRLKEHGLGPHCLELHSSKTDRRHFLGQLRAAWEEGGAADDRDWIVGNGKLQRRRDELNTYVEALHARHGNGLSAYAAVGTVLRGVDRDVPALSFPAADAHDAEARQALEDLAEEAGRTFAAVGTRPALRFVNVEQWSGTWQRDLLAAASGLGAAAGGLAAAFDGFLEALGLPSRPDADLPEIERFEVFAAALDACAASDHAVVFDPDFDALAPALRALGESVSGAKGAEARLVGHFAREEMARIPLDDLERDWRAAAASAWPLRVTRLAKVRNLLATYAASGKPEPQEVLPILRRLKGHLDDIAANPLAGGKLGFAGLDSDIPAMAAHLSRCAELRRAFSELPLDDAEAQEAIDAFAPVAMAGEDRYGVRPAAAALRAAMDAFAAAGRAFTDAAGCDPAAIIAAGSLGELAAAMDEIAAAQTALADWSSWCAVKHRATAAGLGPLVEALEAGRLSPDFMGSAFRLAYARWWAPLVLDAVPALREFRRFKHEHAIGEFRALDDFVRGKASERVRHRIAHGLPPAHGVPRNSELGLLNHQMALKRPSKSIREMIAAMPQSFPKLAPCLLMSPLSIAQYLPPAHPLFDVVIFDEASQITTWDAVGAIARARQTVIVGDPKQLPPTNFFARNEEDDAEVEEHQKDLESILDEARTSGLPVRYLTWHYRSRDESLIAFSNGAYYGNRLVTFPAPEAGRRAVQLKRVPEGVYVGGQSGSRTNPLEARAVADEAAARMRAALDLPEKARPTLGIITFNLPQQALIQDLLDKARRDDPALEWFFSEDRFEPTIVKNLENVQGDERDVILFSITYTKDAAGVRRMNFGALNRDGGERRLNVAITRARQEMLVFSGTEAEHLDLSRTAALGVRHLKAFLDYAARGPEALAAPDRGSVGAAESPFEEAVAIALAARGWKVVPQVGVSAFRIDLAVQHPEQPGRYLAGIECDGATYHRSATARDRDKVREEVLRGLGWTILRVWSTDWWRDADGALKALDEALKALLAKGAPEPAAAASHWDLGAAVDPVADAAEAPELAEAPEAPEAGPEPEERVGQAAPTRPAPDAAVRHDGPFAERGGAETGARYLTADLSAFTARPDQFFEASYRPTLAGMIETVLDCEAPVREDVLAQRIARVHGWLRTGPRIKARIAHCLGAVERTSESTGEFLWRAGSVRDLITYRAPSGEASRRAIAEIPLAELAFVVDRNRHILEEPDPALALARLLGIDRLGATTRPRLAEAIERVALRTRAAVNGDAPPVPAAVPPGAPQA
jgi:very-short-patch-repair endonuclease